MKNKFALIIFVLSAFIGACSDDESPGNQLPSEPEAKAANDATGKGIYKGTFVVLQVISRST